MAKDTGNLNVGSSVGAGNPVSLETGKARSQAESAARRGTLLWGAPVRRIADGRMGSDEGPEIQLDAVPEGLLGIRRPRGATHAEQQESWLPLSTVE